MPHSISKSKTGLFYWASWRSQHAAGTGSGGRKQPGHVLTDGMETLYLADGTVDSRKLFERLAFENGPLTADFQWEAGPCVFPVLISSSPFRAIRARNIGYICYLGTSA